MAADPPHADPAKLRELAYRHLDPFVCSTEQTRELAHSMVSAAARIESQAAEIAELKRRMTEVTAQREEFLAKKRNNERIINETRSKLAAAEAERDKWKAKALEFERTLSQALNERSGVYKPAVAAVNECRQRGEGDLRSVIAGIRLAASDLLSAPGEGETNQESAAVAEEPASSAAANRSPNAGPGTRPSVTAGETAFTSPAEEMQHGPYCETRWNGDCNCGAVACSPPADGGGG